MNRLTTITPWVFAAGPHEDQLTDADPPCTGTGSHPRGTPYLDVNWRMCAQAAGTSRKLRATTRGTASLRDSTEDRTKDQSRMTISNLLRGAPVRFLARDVVDEVTWLHAKRRRDIQERQHAGIALPVLNVDEASKAQSTTLREFFQAEATPFPEPTDLHTEGQESRVR